MKTKEKEKEEEEEEEQITPTDIEEDNFTLSSKMNKRWRSAPRPEVERFRKHPKKFPKPAEKLTLANPPKTYDKGLYSDCCITLV